MNAILCPPHNLTQIVGSCGKAIISSRKIGQSSHLVVLPNEPEVDVADVVRRTVESPATPALAEELRFGGLGNTHHDCFGFFEVPTYLCFLAAQIARSVKDAG